jgi:hypothetical protein
MEIDRRQLLTGVAVTTAAASLPVLPAHGASFGAERFYYSVSFLFSLSIPWSHAANVAQHDSRWHFDPNPKGRILIKHEGSGLTFHRAAQSPDPFVMEAVFIDGPLDGWPDAEEIAAVGRASVWAFVDAMNLRFMERRRGAFYFQYRQDVGGGYRPPYVVESAPALI